MQFRPRLIISIIIIVLVSWADIDYVSDPAKHLFSLPGRQAAHVVALTITLITGYYNWNKEKGKWLASLWLICYGITFLLLLSTAVIYLLHADARQYVAFVLKLRNTFTGPLPFLVFYILSQASNMMKAKQDH